ncbi:hypothetical protein ACFQY7_49535 [Actinomadura luteofluorescens]|uniref:hypothetical protein n=1 Tax=Actinomadura luteofluorescens TaxID=46163 RepID=UPI00363787B6
MRGLLVRGAGAGDLSVAGLSVEGLRRADALAVGGVGLVGLGGRLPRDAVAGFGGAHPADARRRGLVLARGRLGGARDLLGGPGGGLLGDVGPGVADRDGLPELGLLAGAADA